MNTFISGAVVGLSLVSSIAASHAETASGYLRGITGKVLVNDGKGYRAALPTIAVKAGYDIFLAEGASATLHFNDANCEVALATAGVTRVSGASMCQQAQLIPGAAEYLRGSAGDVVITPTNGTYLPPPPAGVINPLFIAGGIFTISAAAFTKAVLEKPVSSP